MSPEPGRPLRIAVDLRRMHKTGIGRYARNLFSALGAEGPQHTWMAIVQDEGDAAIALSLVPGATPVVRPAAQYSPREMFAAPQLGEVDVFHSPHPYHWGVGARYRTVLTLLDLIQVTHAIGPVNLLAKEPLRGIITRACRRARAMVAISHTTRDEFHRLVGVPLDRMRVTPLSPDPRFEESIPESRVSALREGWRFTDRTILYVGMLQPHKNLERLLQAVALLAAEEPTWATQLAIVGPVVQSDRSRLEARLDALGIRDRVNFLGWLSDSDLQVAYHAAAVVALPSLAEGFGLTLLEAMSCGTPCVAADLPVLREVAGDAADFADPLSPPSIAASLRRVLGDRAHASALIERGRLQVARYSWAQTARGTLAAYADAMRD